MTGDIGDMISYGDMDSRIISQSSSGKFYRLFTSAPAPDKEAYKVVLSFNGEYTPGNIYYLPGNWDLI